MERRLAAIMAADIAGYSRLMGDDESGTLVALKLHLKELIDPEIDRNNGRVVKLMGDGFLAEFPSAVNALLCAVEIQRGLSERNLGVPKTRQISYRIGINVGDVIVDGDDIHGDGVNIASRLEALAEPGTICVSASVYDQVKNKVQQSFEDLGNQSVKNISEPVHVYRVLTEPGAKPVEKKLRWLSKTGFVGATAVMLTLFFVIGAIFLWQQTSGIAPPTERGVESLAPTKAATQTEPTSIAVLPFANRSKMEDQAFFAGGMTDDLITELTKIAGLIVIARDSSFNFRDSSPNFQEIGQKLNARYLLQGSVRRSSDRVRINVSLVDAPSGSLVWGERYDGELADVFDLQDKITKNIVTALSLELEHKEHGQIDREQPANLAAYEEFLKGRDKFLRFSKDDTFSSRVHLKKAIELDPNFAHAYAILAWNYVFEYINGWSVATERTLEQARALADEAISLNPRLPFSYFVKGMVYRERFQFAEAVEEAKKAIEIDPSYANAYVLLATVLYYTGRPEDGLKMISKAERLNPLHPSNYPYHKGQALFILERYKEAAEAFKKGLEQNPTSQRLRVWLAATYAQLGRQDDAEWEADQILLEDPDFKVSKISHVFPFKDEKDLGRFKAALSKVGFDGRW